VVSTRRKLVLLARAWAQAGWIKTRSLQPEPLLAIRFLIDGCQADVLARNQAQFFPNRAMPQRVEWVFGLLERLENAKRERVGLVA
jgi:phytoene synthase